MAKLYATSMLWTLNARRSIRTEYDSRSGNMASASVSTQPGGISRGGIVHLVVDALVAFADDPSQSTTMEFEHTASQMHCVLSSSVLPREDT